jgi:hypothetical protein
MHKFSIGQIVQFHPGPGLTNATPGRYEVTRLLPGQAGELSYQIKSVNESHDRNARESQLTSPE